MNLKRGILLAATLVLVDGAVLQAQHAHSGGNQFVAAPRPVARPATPNLGGTPYPYRGLYAPSTGLTAPAASYTGITPGALAPTGANRYPNRYPGNNYNNSYVRNNRFPLYAGFYGIPYLPFVDDSSYYSFPSYSEQAAAAGAQASVQETVQAQDAMAQELDRMNYELHVLRDSQMQMQQGGPQPYGPQPYGPPPALMPTPSATEPQAPQIPITLVMQNGATVSVNNYAVMNDIIWDFSKQPARKIPISTINVPASEKATQNNGGEFPSLTASR